MASSTGIAKKARSKVAVGMYVQGASPVGALDLSGNIWQWCLNEYLTPERVEITGDKPRVVRGGSFLYKLDFARAKYRDRDLPTWRNLGHGFRLARWPAARGLTKDNQQRQP